ncbi:FAD dependent oxidoreductase [Purpureocillium lilacinum]|uniref:FAD dependent oxidoreductase n=1 Tax=Purpureocillium lilacinum TaxID=33203 RepID=A0A179HMU0_PURLI|nr:FAD dependent oxidoreductase [Purpureocillium lilacinum]OAQ91324.1 FAD dependent oxidoreductase [Purpureocillium lilacinum]
MDMLPVDNPTASYWLSDPHPLAKFRSSDAVPDETDIAIIGTGMAGVSTAYHILKQCKSATPPSITLLDARDACSGATGRNGGHVKTILASVKKWYESHGPDGAAVIIAWVAAQCRALKKVVEEEDLDCEFLVRRSYDVLYDTDQAAELKSWLRDRRKEGVEWLDELQWLEGPHLDRIVGAKGAIAAVGGPAVSLWPYKLVTSLLALVVDKGAKLYTNTAVHAIDRGSDTIKLSTSRGVMRAKKVVYATNGYTAGLLPQYRNIIVPFLGQNSRLVPNEQTLRQSPNLAATLNLHHMADSVDYLNPRPDGSITHGGGTRNFRRDANDRNERWFNNVDDSKLISDEVAADFERIDRQRLYGWEDSEAKVDSIWTGVMGLTPDGLPHVGQVPGTRNEWLLAGFNGGGMVFIFTMTQGLADMVLEGKELEQTAIPVLFKTTEERLKKKCEDVK